MKNEKIDISLYFFAASEEHDDEDDKYELLLEGAKFADQNGLKGVWIPERHFTNFGDRFPNPSVCAAAIAAVTQKIKIRSGSVVLPLHDPIRVTEEWSMVDNLSHGRVELAVASGWHPNDFSLAPENFKNRHEIMKQRLEEVRELWSGKTITRTNGIGKTCNLRTFPKPIQTELPIWITAGATAETYRFAGSIGANVVTNLLLQSKNDLKEKIDIYYDSLEKNGFDPDEGVVSIMVHTFISEDLDYVEKVVKKPFKSYLLHFIELLRPLAEKTGIDLNRARNLLGEMGYERYFNGSGLFGPVEHCLELVDEFASYGVREIACLVDFGIDVQCTLDHLPNIKVLREKIIARGV